MSSVNKNSGFENLGSKTDQAKDKVASDADHTKDKMSSNAEYAKDKVASGTEQAKDKVTSAFEPKSHSEKAAGNLDGAEELVTHAAPVLTFAEPRATGRLSQHKSTSVPSNSQAQFESRSSRGQGSPTSNHARSEAGHTLANAQANTGLPSNSPIPQLSAEITESQQRCEGIVEFHAVFASPNLEIDPNGRFIPPAGGAPITIVFPGLQQPVDGISALKAAEEAAKQRQYRPANLPLSIQRRYSGPAVSTNPLHISHGKFRLVRLVDGKPGWDLWAFPDQSWNSRFRMMLDDEGRAVSTRMEAGMFRKMSLEDWENFSLISHVSHLSVMSNGTAASKNTKQKVWVPTLTSPSHCAFYYGRVMDWRSPLSKPLVHTRMRALRLENWAILR